MKLCRAILFLSLTCLAESPTNSLNLSVMWDQDKAKATNILYYVVHHAGPDGRMTNVARVYPFSIGKNGLSYSVNMKTGLSALQGTNYVGVSAWMAGGLMSETNVKKSLVIFDLP